MTTAERVAERLDERYGRTGARRARRTAIIVAGAVGLAVFGVLAVSTWSNAANAVDVDTTAFTIDSPHQVEISFQVTPPAGAAFACVLEAQDVEHGVVGWRVVEFAPLATRPAAFTETVPTTAPATTGFVDRCWVT